MIRELLLVCPDPNAPDFEGREEEFRMNLATRAALTAALETIEAVVSLRQIQQRNDDGTKNPTAEGILAGMYIGEEIAAKRIISRFIGTFDAH